MFVVAGLVLGSACSSGGGGGGRAGGGGGEVAEAGDGGAGPDGGAGRDGQSSTGDATTTSTAPPTTTTTAPQELPGGGREIFPGHRVVAYYGNSESAAMGVLGETPPDQAAPRLAAAAQPFSQPDKPVLGAFELIVSVAQASAGPDGDFSEPTPPEQVLAWLEAARAANVLLILDIQPGRSSFVDAVKPYRDFLREPDVSLALDPEWRMGPTEVPGRTIGSVDVAEINEVSAWLSDIVQKDNLPQKLFIVHQFTTSMIANRPALANPPGLATVIHIDGFGTRNVKLEKYNALKVAPPFYNALKLFYDEDTNIFSPAEVLALPDPPDLISYQ